MKTKYSVCVWGIEDYSRDYYLMEKIECDSFENAKIVKTSLLTGSYEGLDGIITIEKNR